MQKNTDSGSIPGADPGFDQGGAPRDQPKLPFWGLSFVEFWCWGLIFGGQGGPGPTGPPPGSAPVSSLILILYWKSNTIPPTPTL